MGKGNIMSMSCLSGADMFLGAGLPLSSALDKLEGPAGSIKIYIALFTAHMFIINPLTGSNPVNIFSTCYSTKERIRKLSDRMEGKLL